MVQINKDSSLAQQQQDPQPKGLRYVGIAFLIVLGLILNAKQRGYDHSVRGTSVTDGSRLPEIIARLEDVKQHVHDQSVSLQTMQDQQSEKMEQLVSDIRAVKEGFDTNNNNINHSPETETKDKPEDEVSPPLIHLPGKPAPHAMFLAAVSAHHPSPDLFDETPIDLGTTNPDGTRTAEPFYFPKACHEIKSWVMTLSPQEIKITKLFQQSFTQAMSNSTASRDRPLFVDVGSNCGFYSLMAAAHGLQVDAYDLQPTCAQHVATSVAHNRWSQRIQVYWTGMSDGNSQLFDGSTFGTGCFGAFPARPGPLDEGSGLQRVSVPLTSIDQHYNVHRPIHFLKADTEGNEIKVMQGARKSFEQHIIQNAIIEFTPSFWKDQGYQKKDAVDALCEILNFGYHISWHLEEVYLEDCEAIVAFFDNPWKLLSQDLLFQLKQ